MAILMLSSTFFVSIPDNMIVPASCASGLSIDCLNEIAGKLRIDDSSLIVPESEMQHNAFFCKKT